MNISLIGADGKYLNLAEIERQVIEITLRRCKFKYSKAAKVLGIGRTTLYRKTKQA